MPAVLEKPAIKLLHCGRCNAEFPEKMLRDHQDKKYCLSCFDHEFITCPICAKLKSAVGSTIDSELGVDRVCRDCYLEYLQCEHCGRRCHKNSLDANKKCDICQLAEKESNEDEKLIGDSGNRPSDGEKNEARQSQRPTKSSQLEPPPEIPEMAQVSIKKEQEEYINEYFSGGTNMFRVSRLKMGVHPGEEEGFLKEFEIKPKDCILKSTGKENPKTEIKEVLKRTFNGIYFKPDRIEALSRLCGLTALLEKNLKEPILHNLKDEEFFTIRPLEELIYLNNILGAFQREDSHLEEIVADPRRYLTALKLSTDNQKFVIPKSLKTKRKMAFKFTTKRSVETNTLFRFVSRLFGYHRKTEGLPAAVFPGYMIQKCQEPIYFQGWSANKKPKNKDFSKKLCAAMERIRKLTDDYKNGKLSFANGSAVIKRGNTTHKIISFLEEIRDEYMFVMESLDYLYFKTKFSSSLRFGNELILSYDKYEFIKNSSFRPPNIHMGFSGGINRAKQAIDELAIWENNYIGAIGNGFEYKRLGTEANEALGTCQHKPNARGYALGIYDWFVNSDLTPGYILSKAERKIVARMAIRRMYNEKYFPGVTFYMMERIYATEGFFSNIKKDLQKAFIHDLAKNLKPNEAILLPNSSRHDSAISCSYTPDSVRQQARRPENFNPDVLKGDSSQAVFYQWLRPKNCGRYCYYHDSVTRTKRIKEFFLTDFAAFSNTWAFFPDNSIIYEKKEVERPKPDKNIMALMASQEYNEDDDEDGDDDWDENDMANDDDDNNDDEDGNMPF